MYKAYTQRPDITREHADILSYELVQKTILNKGYLFACL